MKTLQTVLSLIAAPIVVPAMLALEAVDTLVFQDRSTFGNDLHAAASNAIADVSGEPRPFNQ
jgi:hypothetical protein